MTNNQLTKEWLQQTIAELESVRDEIPFGIDTNSELELAAFKLALGAMDSEPVEWLNGCNKTIPAALRYLAENPRPIGGESSFNTAHLYQLAREIELMAEAPLYRHAQPAPVVPDNSAITQHFDTIALEAAREILCDVNRRNEFLGGEVQLLSRIQCRIDDACRAAMLAAAPQEITNGK